MANIAAAMVRKAIQSFIEGDVEMARSVLSMDDDVDRLNRQYFYALATRIRENAGESPQSLNALVIVRNLERVGDHATNIAEDVIFWVQGDDVRHHISSNVAGLQNIIPSTSPDTESQENKEQI
jgi:phosphate transport system protein